MSTPRDDRGHFPGCYTAGCGVTSCEIGRSQWLADRATKPTQMPTALPIDVFLDLCTKLRAMGATSVSAGDMSATFPPAQPPRAMPASAREPRPPKSDDEIPRLDGDGPEDIARRRGYSEVARTLAG